MSEDVSLDNKMIMIAMRMVLDAPAKSNVKDAMREPFGFENGGRSGPRFCNGMRRVDG